MTEGRFHVHPDVRQVRTLDDVAPPGSPPPRERLPGLLRQGAGGALDPVEMEAVCPGTGPASTPSTA